MALPSQSDFEPIHHAASRGLSRDRRIRSFLTARRHRLLAPSLDSLRPSHVFPKWLASYRKHSENSLRQRQKMLGAFFITYAKFLEANPGLIPPTEVKRHFRWHLHRFWRRIRGPCSVATIELCHGDAFKPFEDAMSRRLSPLRCNSAGRNKVTPTSAARARKQPLPRLAPNAPLCSHFEVVDDEAPLLPPPKLLLQSPEVDAEKFRTSGRMHLVADSDKVGKARTERQRFLENTNAPGINQREDKLSGSAGVNQDISSREIAEQDTPRRAYATGRPPSCR